MAFSASYMVIAVRYLLLGEQCQTMLAHDWDGAAIAAASAGQVAEAYWNDVKDAWRNLAPNDLTYARFVSVQVREVGGNLSLGEYAIPADEQEGLRSSVGLGGMLPSYAAVGCRLTVNTTVTRPGQKRVPFLTESDNVNNDVDPDFLTLVEPLAEKWSSTRTLGAPTATGVLNPFVLTYGADQNTVTAAQPVIGYVLNPFVTSQVSRRKGHGS